MAQTQPTKIVKGGFRATLALIISIVALILSVMAYTSSESKEGLKSRIGNLQTTMEKMKADSAEQINSLRNETAKALEKMSQIVKKPEPAQGGNASGN